jgi:uncharacterized protein (TIGR02996 family)
MSLPEDTEPAPLAPPAPPAPPAPSAPPPRDPLRDLLLAAVYAAPEDDDPRLVYADKLLEQGDPRGELVMLQLARARGTIDGEGPAREAALLADEARVEAWGQPLSAAGRCTFERGFPAAIELHRGAKVLPDDPAWATITTVRGISEVSEQVARRLCELPGLRSIEVLPLQLLEELCRTPRRWTRVGAEGPRAPSAEAFAALPELRELSLEVPGRYGAVDLPRALERLHISAGALPELDLGRLPRLVELRLAFRYAEPIAIPPWLQRLVIDSRGPLPQIAFARPSGLESAVLRGDRLAAEALRELASLEELTLSVNQLTGVLDGLPRLRRLSLYCARGVEPDALARLARLEELQVTGASADRAPRLDGLPLQILEWRGLPLAQLPDGLPLRRASVDMPETLGELEEFVARHPILERLELTHLRADPEAELERSSDGPWRSLAARLERSGIRHLHLRAHDQELTLVRDAGGHLSRLHLAGTDFRIAEHLARALARVTSIESAAELPPSLAQLVR